MPRRSPRKLKMWGATFAATAVAMAGLAVMPVAGASQRASTAVSRLQPAASGKLVFDLVNNGCASDPFWAAVNNGTNDAAKTLGVTVHIVEALNCESQADENTLLTSVVNSKPAGIAISETSATAFSSNIQRAVKLNIPIIAYNSIPPNNNPVQDPIEAFVGSDLYEAGVAMGYGITEYHLAKGNAVPVFTVCATNIACITRDNGFTAVATKAGITTPKYPITQSTSQDISIVHGYLVEHPKTKMIIAEGAIDAVVKALQGLNYKPGQIKVGEYDFNGNGPEYIKQGWLQYAIDQEPFLQGFDSVVDLYNAAKYGQPPVNIGTGPVTITVADTAWISPSMDAITGL